MPRKLQRDRRDHKPAEKADSKRNSNRSWQIASLIIALAIVCIIITVTHWPALSAQVMSLDDNGYLKDNPLVQNPSWSSVKRFITEVFEPSSIPGAYIPLTMISQTLDYAMGGRQDNLMPFHRTSLILHVANTALVVMLLYQLFGSI